MCKIGISLQGCGHALLFRKFLPVVEGGRGLVFEDHSSH